MILPCVYDINFNRFFHKIVIWIFKNRSKLNYYMKLDHIRSDIFRSYANWIKPLVFKFFGSGDFLPHNQSNTHWWHSVITSFVDTFHVNFRVIRQENKSWNHKETNISEFQQKVNSGAELHLRALSFTSIELIYPRQKSIGPWVGVFRRRIWIPGKVLLLRPKSGPGYRSSGADLDNYRTRFYAFGHRSGGLGGRFWAVYI